MAYLWDIFVSYPRNNPVGQWVHKHFHPVLQGCLDGLLPTPPRIFIDVEQPTGTKWPQHIVDALLKSRMLIAVWTPPYFRSGWCMAEWETMLQRESYFKSQGKPLERGLVYPVVYSDGKHFDPRAKSTTYRRDLTSYTYPYSGFRESAAYLKFHDAVASIAEEIESHLELIPEWEPNWPVATPPPTTEAKIGLAKL